MHRPLRARRGGRICGHVPGAAGTADNQFNFRQNSPANSMQITGTWNFQSDQWQIQIDIDPNNPLGGNLLRHSVDVVGHWLTGRDTNYQDVASALGINPSTNDPYCNP
jgi:hypothetical protein